MDVTSAIASPSGPRDRLLLHGARALSDTELIAVLLGTGAPGRPVAVAAAELLSHAGGLAGLAQLSAAEFASRRGVGAGKATRLLAAIELGARLSARPLARDSSIGSSSDLDAALRPLLRGDNREHFFAIAVDARNRPVAQIEVAVGGLSACAISPADVFRPVVRHAALGVLFAHNHPSGETAPSEEDALVTRRLVQAGRLLGVQVLDHVILGHDGYFSFLDAGLLER